MGKIIKIGYKGFFKRLAHKLFNCPTFWKSLINKYTFRKSLFSCPRCSKKYHCYWDGNDVSGHGIDYCNKCAKILESGKYDKRLNGYVIKK